MADVNGNGGEAKVSKSIVPAKYAGKYANGGNDELAKFINDECKGKEGFDYQKFFDLCSLNGIAEEQVKKYQNQVADKKLGSQGRARMTLRNMLATIARKDGHLKNLDGDVIDIELPKAALGGAAATAKTKQAAASESAAERKF